MQPKQKNKKQTTMQTNKQKKYKQITNTWNQITSKLWSRSLSHESGSVAT